MPAEPSPLDTTGIARHNFSTVRRGYDPAEVRAFLHDLSDVVGRLQRGEAHQLDRAERAEARAELAEQLDEHRLVELLGAETARVLEAAREAAVNIRAKAEESAARMIRDAHADAQAIVDKAEQDGIDRQKEIMAEAERLRRDADSLLDRRRAEGQALVDEMRRGAEAERERMLTEGEQARAAGEYEAERVRGSARDQGRQLVAEAQVVRERMLGDLARRRRTAREQLERLNAARERLLAAYEVVRRTVEEATVELNVALPQAKVASELAARRVSEEPEPTVDELEAELSVARMAGLVEDLDGTSDVDYERVDALIDGGLEATDRHLADGAAEVASAGSRGAGRDEPAERRSIWPFRRRSSDEPTSPEAAQPVGADTAVAPGTPEVPGQPEVPETPATASADVGADAEPDHVEELFARLKDDRRPAGSTGAEGSQGDEAVGVAGSAVAVIDEAERSDAATDVEGVQAGAGDDVDGAHAEASEADAGEAELEAPEDDEELDPDVAALRQRDDRLGPVERELGRRLKRVLADEQNEVFDLLRRAHVKGLDDMVPGPTEHARRYADAALPDLDAAATEGAASIEGQVSSSCSALAGELGTSLVEPMRQRIARSLEDSEGDLEEVTERLRSLYREWKGQRIGAAVRHYTAAAYAWGVYEASPARTELRWLVDRSGESCPDADDNALAGGVSKGQPFPTGVLCSPAHPDCRCLVVPADAVGSSGGAPAGARR